MGAYENKSEIRKTYEEVTDPDSPQPLVALHSPILSALLAVRSGIGLLNNLTDNMEPPSPEHAEIHQRMRTGLRERMTAFELELLGTLVDEAWEINCCNCDHCQKVAAEAEVEDKARKAKYN